MAEEQQDQAGPGSTEHVLEQVREALNDVAGSATEVVGAVYRQGENYARQAGERYPEARQYARKAQRLVTRHTTGSPLLSLVAAGAIGYALAWMIHRERRNQEPDVPDYGRTDRGYAPHRGQERL
jgi:hypothetical protein